MAMSSSSFLELEFIKVPLLQTSCKDLKLLPHLMKDDFILVWFSRFLSITNSWSYRNPFTIFQGSPDMFIERAQSAVPVNACICNLLEMENVTIILFIANHSLASRFQCNRRFPHCSHWSFSGCSAHRDIKLFKSCFSYEKVHRVLCKSWPRWCKEWKYEVELKENAFQYWKSCLLEESTIFLPNMNMFRLKLDCYWGLKSGLMNTLWALVFSFCKCCFCLLVVPEYHHFIVWKIKFISEGTFHVETLARIRSVLKLSLNKGWETIA